MRTPLEPVLLIILLNLTVNQASPMASEAFIKIRQFQVPAKVRLGEPLQLRCDYELGSGEILHAMKLFKDDKEFYRFTPTSNHEDQRMAFQVPGCPIDLARSDQFSATISRVDRRSAGQYKCQVSVEGTFRSISQERKLEVLFESARAADRHQLAGGDFSGAVSGRQRQRPAGRPMAPHLRHANEQQPSMEANLHRSFFASSSNSGSRRAADWPLALLCTLAALSFYP